MIDEYLADLICQHDERLYPYLKIRAIHAKSGGGESVIIDKHSGLFMSDLKAIKITGLIKFENTDWPVLVRLMEDGKYLGYPEKTVSTHVDSKQYVPRDLQKLVEILGYPGDWEKNIPKYRKLYTGLASEVPSPIIESVAIWTAREYPDYELNMFISRQCFSSLRSKMEAPKSAKTLSRTEASGYDNQDSFEEYDRKLLNGN